MMIRRGIILALVTLGSVTLLQECEDCGTCEMVTEFTDGTELRGTPQILCGTELNDKIDYYQENSDGSVTWYDCN